jgi:Kef-type K+ transport system membrane component KefB
MDRRAAVAGMLLEEDADSPSEELMPPHRAPRIVLPALGLAALPAAALAAGDHSSASGPSTAAFMLVLALAIGGAKLGGLLAERLGQPAVLGELLAGIALGPSVAGRLGLPHVDPSNVTLKLLASVGVVLLLFEIGLETDLGEMIRAGVSSTRVALIGVAVPLLLGFAVVEGLSWTGLLAVAPGTRAMLALFLGATLTATSVGITARVLKDLGRMGSPESRILIGAAVIDDVIGLVILAVVTGVGAAVARGVPVGSVLSPGRIAAQLVLALAFLGLAVLVGRRFAPRLLDAVDTLERRGLLVATAACAMFLLAWGAAVAGSAVILGGFAAGLVLASTRQVEPIEQEMAPLVHVFAPVFFVMVGAAVDVTTLNPFDRSHWPTLLLAFLLLAVAIAGKIVAGLGVRESGVNRLAVGVGMVPRGEVGLIFAQAGRDLSVGTGSLLSPALYSALTLTILLTTLVTPPALRLVFARELGSEGPS